MLAMALGITIIGLPFAWAHLKLAGIALWPIGKAIVSADDAPLRYPPPRRVLEDIGAPDLSSALDPSRHEKCRSIRAALMARSLQFGSLHPGRSLWF